MKISEILWKAANESLWDGSGHHYNRETYSCAAVAEAEGVSVWWESKTVAFLKEFGVTPESRTEFDEFKYGGDQQGARYAWLMFAAMIAEEEGK